MTSMRVKARAFPLLILILLLLVMRLGARLKSRLGWNLMAVIESYLQDACRAIYQRAHPHLIILSLCRVGYLHRELTENVLVWVFVPGIIVEGPPKFPVSLAAGAILNCGNPICGH